MYLIRIDENGAQQQYKFPGLEKDGIENEKIENSTLSKSGKEARIKKMMEASGKKVEEKIEFINRVEPNYIYASISGYEYIKMNIVEFFWFVNILNALIEIDSDELGFYGINLFVPKENVGAGTHSYELVSFELGEYSSTVLGMSDALKAGLFNSEDPLSFFDNIRYLG